eukprot:GHRQ01032523.1.p1 GENE.GHRQ01032523.1~~GHRQ01032523.1.p1  ORF type:complete len:124 (-),score=24.78 GHRQ01032523.1:121-492(-)
MKLYNKLSGSLKGSTRDLCYLVVLLLVVLLEWGGGAPNGVAAQTVADTRQLVPQSSSKVFPFSAVGQLANGCTGFLIGPCHVMTVAHCVVEPWKGIWWNGLDFYPGRLGDLQRICDCSLKRCS